MPVTFIHDSFFMFAARRADAAFLAGFRQYTNYTLIQ